MSEREEKFEQMLQDVQTEYELTISKMEKLKTEGKTKTVTYKQLMGTKLTLQNILSRYEIYGLRKTASFCHISAHTNKKCMTWTEKIDTFL